MTGGADAGSGSRDAGGAGAGAGAGSCAGKRGAPVATSVPSGKRAIAGAGSVQAGPEVSGVVSGTTVPATVTGAIVTATPTAPEDSEMYEVEALIGRKKSRGARYDHGFRKGTWIYLVKWEGYEEATWEDARNIENSLIEAYEDEYGSAHTSDFDSDADRDGQGGKTSPSGQLREACSTRKTQTHMKKLHQQIFGSSGDSD